MTLPDTKPYRVIAAGVRYRKAEPTLSNEGQESVVMTLDMALRGATVNLVDFEARRLSALAAVVPADADRTYDELSDDELSDLTAERGIPVVGTAADGTVRREDRINALNIYDTGHSAVEMVGVGTAPGGVVVNRSGTSEGRFTHVPSEQQQARGGVDVNAPVGELAAQMRERKLSADETVALAEDDPDLARKVLEAEHVASGGSPRGTVEKRLQKIASGQ